MSTTVAELSNPLPTAKQAKEMLALAEAEKASEALRQKKKADAEKKALIDKLSKPSGISEQEALKRAAEIVQRAIKNGLDRGGGLPLSQRAVHRPRPRDKQLHGARLGEHPDRAAEGDVSLLGSAPAPARIQDPRSGRRLLRRCAGRHRFTLKWG